MNWSTETRAPSIYAPSQWPSSWLRGCRLHKPPHVDRSMLNGWIDRTWKTRKCHLGCLSHKGVEHGDSCIRSTVHLAFQGEGSLWRLYICHRNTRTSRWRCEATVLFYDSGSRVESGGSWSDLRWSTRYSYILRLVSADRILAESQAFSRLLLFRRIYRNLISV